MNSDLPRRTHRRSLSFAPRWFLCLVLFRALVPIDSFAQIFDTTGRWNARGTELSTGFPVDTLSLSRLMFADTLMGFAVAGNKPFVTNDGGVSWAPPTRNVASLKFRSRGGTVYNTSGEYTRDGGGEWNLFQFARPSDGGAHYYFMNDVVLFSRDRMVAIYAESVPQPDTFYIRNTYGGDTVYTASSIYWGPNQLAMSTDGGTTWRAYDTLIHHDTVDAYAAQSRELVPAFADKQFPVPDGALRVYGYEWKFLAPGGPDTSVVRLMLSATVQIPDSIVQRQYLYSIDRQGNLVEQGELPLPFAAMGFVSDSVVAAAYDPPTLTPREYYRSDDAGATWHQIPSPTPDMPPPAIRFLSPDVAVADGRISRDGWKTWERWGSPMVAPFATTEADNLNRFYALDTGHFYAVGEHSFFGVSSDQGRSWNHHQTGGGADAIAAHAGRVIVARPYQSVLVSSDSGESWRDVGVEGNLPPELGRFLAIAFVDTAGAPEELAGLATFVSYDSTHYIASLLSSDSGIHWTIGVPLAVSNRRPSSPTRLRFVPNDQGGGTTGFLLYDSALYVSSDGGESWELRDVGFPISAVAMSDSKHGVASAYVPHPGIPGALYATGDGGRTWTKTLDLTEHSREFAHLIHAFDDRHYVAIMRDYQRASDWDYIASEDGGNTWSEAVRGYGAVDDIVRWIDRNRVYGVDRGGTIYYSNSGGRVFDSIHVDRDYIAGRSGIAAADAEFIYIAGESGRLARWRMTGSPSSGIEDGSPVVATATLLGNPVVDGRAVIRCAFATSGAVRIDLYDIRGALLRSSVGDVDAGVNDLSVDLGAFPSGRYLVRLIGEGVSAEVPVMLTN